MKNQIINKLHSRISVDISGKNPERFILRLYKNKINILSIKRLTKEKYKIIINYTDYEKLLKLNTIYEINNIHYLGMVKKRQQFFKYYHVLICLIAGIMSIYILSNIIFKVEVVTNDEEMRTRLISTLKKYNIDKYHFQKKYDYLQKVKEDILEEYHDEIEWIEISKVGTKYIIKYEPRIIKDTESKTNYRHLIAKKNAIIRSIYASKGQIVKNKYDYVNKGDIIISGYIYSNEEIKDTVSALGHVYGEVWYTTKVIYPFNYYEEKKTGREKNVYSVKFFNKQIDLFNFHPFNDKIIDEKVLLKNNVLPLKLVEEHQEEVIITTEMNVVEEVKLKAIALAYEKMEQQLNEDEYIITYRVLSSKIIDKGIEMQIFFSICEDISDYVDIVEMKEAD